MLSPERYRWLCVLGAEIAYFLCLFGGLLPLRTGRGMELHKALFETMPGFVWLSPGSVALGAVYIFLLAWIVGSYMVWMHNSSPIRAEQGEQDAPKCCLTVQWLSGPFCLTPFRYSLGFLHHGRDEHHRAKCCAHDTLGGATNEHAVDHTFPVDVHHEQVGFFGAKNPQNDSIRYAVFNPSHNVRSAGRGSQN